QGGKEGRIANVLRRKPCNGALKNECMHCLLSGLTFEKLLHAPFWRERGLGIGAITSDALAAFEEGQQTCDGNLFVKTNQHARPFSVACHSKSSRTRDTRSDTVPSFVSSPRQDPERIER